MTLELVPMKRRLTDAGYSAAHRPPSSVPDSGAAPHFATGASDTPAGTSGNVEAPGSTGSTRTVAVNLTPTNPDEVTEDAAL